MPYKRGTSAGLIAGCLFLACCSAALYIPSKDMDEHARARLMEGRRLYQEKCGSCHALVLPEKHAPGRWPGLLDKMEARAKVTPAEKALILKYLKKE